MKQNLFRGFYSILIVLALIACSDSGGSDPIGSVPASAPAPAPTSAFTYAISLSQTQLYTFPAAVQGYEMQEALSITVANTGNQATGILTVELSNTTDFTSSSVSLASISVGSHTKFSVRPKNGLNPGTYTADVTVFGGNGINASFNVSFTVNTKNTTFTVDPIEAQVYTGTAIQPVVTVKDATTLLTLNTDYTVSYENNINVGTGTVIINGIGNYEGNNESVNFAINAKTITFNIDAISAQTHTRSEIQPTVNVRDGTTLLTLNTDYSISYANNINAGTATVTIVGMGNYAGSSGSATFTINPKVIAFTIDPIAVQVYTGSAIRPPVNVKDDNVVLTLNTDYNVSYSNNINSGTASVTIIGIGNYAGSSGSANFEINTSIITFTIDPITTQTYTGNALQPIVTVKDGLKTLTLNTDYIVSYTNNINAGTASVTITGTGGYAGSFGSTNFTINPKVIAFSVDSIAAQTYSRNVIEPTVTVRDSTTELTRNTHYTVSYSNNINAGTANVTIEGMGNYAGSSGNTTFTINPKVITFSVDSIIARTYNGNAHTPVVTVKDGEIALTLISDYTVSYTNNINAGIGTVSITGAGNYVGSLGGATFTINSKIITFTIDTIPAQTYDGSPLSPTVTVRDGSEILTQNTDYTVLYTDNINAGIATIIITGMGNYAGSSGSATFTILQPVPQDRLEYYWVNEHGNLVTTSSGVVVVTVGEILLITAQGTGYVVKQWHLNGVNTDQSGNTYEFSSTTTGKHTVGLFVEKDGKPYNTNITITVQ